MLVLAAVVYLVIGLLVVWATTWERVPLRVLWMCVTIIAWLPFVVIGGIAGLVAAVHDAMTGGPHLRM